jgi:tetratricopeptide (TPR) repeat protein
MSLGRDPRAEAFAAGLDALRHEEFEQAVERLESAEALGSAEGNVPAYLSSAYLATGHPLEAQAAVERALALDPNGFAPQLKAGELSLRLGNLSSAEREFVAALRAADPGTPEMTAARRWLAITRERRRRSVDRRALLPRMPALLRLPRLRRQPQLNMEEEPS